MCRQLTARQCRPPSVEDTGARAASDIPAPRSICCITVDMTQRCMAGSSETLLKRAWLRCPRVQVLEALLEVRFPRRGNTRRQAWIGVVCYCPNVGLCSSKASQGRAVKVCQADLAHAGARNALAQHARLQNTHHSASTPTSCVKYSPRLVLQLLAALARKRLLASRAE